MNGHPWRIRWEVSAVDEDGQPLTPIDDDGEPTQVVFGLSTSNTLVIAVGDNTAYLGRNVALDASTGLRTITEQATLTGYPVVIGGVGHLTTGMRRPNAGAVVKLRCGCLYQVSHHAKTRVRRCLACFQEAT